jgi:hypothetical protein
MFLASKINTYNKNEKSIEKSIKKSNERYIIIDKKHNKNLKTKILNKLSIIENESDNTINIINKKKCIDKLNYLLINNIYDINKSPIIILILNIYLENLIQNKKYEILYEWFISLNNENMNNTDINKNNVFHILSFFKLKFKKLYIYYKLDLLKNYFILNNIDTNIVNISGFKFIDIDKFEKCKEYIIKVKIKTKNEPYLEYLNINLNSDRKEIIFNKIIKVKKKNKIDLKEVENLFNKSKIDRDLKEIIEKFSIFVKKNNTIILANNETYEIKKKIIKMFIEDNKDIFDLDFFLLKNNNYQ